MAGFEGIISGQDTIERATRVAGCVAELGVPRLLLQTQVEESWLEARATNLPAEIIRAVSGLEGAETFEISAPSIRAIFRFGAHDASWTCSDAHAALELRRRLNG